MTTLPPRAPLRAPSLNDTKPDRPLSLKQRRFIEEYLIDMNATAAAIRAGYSERAAHSHGSYLARRPNIAAAIERVLAARRMDLRVTAERVIRELARIAFADIGRIIDWSDEDMTVRPPGTLTEDERAAIAEVAVVKRSDGVAARVTLHDKERALEALCRHLGLFGPRAAHKAGLIESPSVAAERIREMIRAKHAKLCAPEPASEETQARHGGHDAERRDENTEI